MNAELQPGQIQKEKLLGIVDIREICNIQSGDLLGLEALFRYEILTVRQILGGALIIDKTECREEWRKVTEAGCFPENNRKYEMT